MVKALQKDSFPRKREDVWKNSNFHEREKSSELLPGALREKEVLGKATGNLKEILIGSPNLREENAGSEVRRGTSALSASLYSPKRRETRVSRA